MNSKNLETTSYGDEYKSKLNDQFAYQEGLSQSVTGDYKVFFNIPQLSQNKQPQSGQPILKGCLYDTQGQVSCGKWGVTKDGYSYR